MHIPEAKCKRLAAAQARLAGPWRCAGGFALVEELVRLALASVHVPNPEIGLASTARAAARAAARATAPSDTQQVACKREATKRAASAKPLLYPSARVVTKLRLPRVSSRVSAATQQSNDERPRRFGSLRRTRGALTPLSARCATRLPSGHVAHANARE